MLDRALGAELVDDVLRDPGRFDDATRDEVARWPVEVHVAGLHAGGELSAERLEQLRERPSEARDLRGDLTQPGELDPELVVEAIDHIDLQPADRIELLDRRRV